MPPVFSSTGKFFKKYLSSSSIKVAILDSYKTTSDTIKKMAKRNDTQLYFTFALSILKGVGAALGGAFTLFAFMLTYKALAQSLSLYIEGWSGTMTIEFETAWLVLSAKSFLVVLCGGLLIVTIKAIFDAIKIHRKLKTLILRRDE